MFGPVLALVRDGNALNLLGFCFFNGLCQGCYVYLPI